MMNDNVIAFPTGTPDDPYVDFVTNCHKMNRFGETMADTITHVSQMYPELNFNFDVRDVTLVGEAILNMIMRAQNIKHPLQEFADTIGGEFTKAYDES